MLLKASWWVIVPQMPTDVYKRQGHNWAAVIPLDRVYNYDPTAGLGELSPEQEKLVLGPQGGLWTELMQYPPRFAEYQVFPRLAALAEVGWSSREKRDYEDFHRRLVRILHQLGPETSRCV